MLTAYYFYELPILHFLNYIIIYTYNHIRYAFVAVKLVRWTCKLMQCVDTTADDVNLLICKMYDFTCYTNYTQYIYITSLKI